MVGVDAAVKSTAVEYFDSHKGVTFSTGCSSPCKNVRGI